MAQCARWAHAPEQGHSRSGQQDRSNRVGLAEAHTHPLRTDRASTCLSITFVKLRGLRTDVGTVERRVVSPVKKSSSLCSYHLLGTMRAHLIMAWLQQQLTCERPDTFTQAASDSRTKDLATPGRTIHFLPRYPSASHCRASHPPKASSASHSRLPEPSADAPETPQDHRTSLATCTASLG